MASTIDLKETMVIMLAVGVQPSSTLALGLQLGSPGPIVTVKCPAIVPEHQARICGGDRAASNATAAACHLICVHELQSVRG